MNYTISNQHDKVYIQYINNVEVKMKQKVAENRQEWKYVMTQKVKACSD